jgi:signal transduction histidine kinase/ActR/RegA family two-component response regulator
MAGFRDLSIRYKLTAAGIATMALALLLVSIAFVAFEAVTFRDRIVRQMGTQAEIVGYNSASALLFEDRDSAVKTLAALRAEPHVIAAGIYTPAGDSFAMYRRKGAGVDGDLDAEVKGDGHRFQDGRLLVHRNILVDGDKVGDVRLLSDLDELTSSLKRYMLISIIAFFTAFGAALPLLARLQRFILDPIMNLVDKARVVSEERDYSVRATPTSEDELGLLVRNFNEMLAQIQKRDQDLERARDDAQAANRAKDEFLAVVSHELRTPLTPVLAWIFMLRSQEIDAERHQHGLDVIERNIKSQAQLIEDLLDISRIISGKLRLDVRPIELTPVVEAAVESVRSAADARNIRLQTILDPRVLMMTGDPERLQQVFWNLLTNAIKFTPKGGRVQVIVRRVNSHVEITVSDTGKGIDPDFLPFVFERFQQADSSTTRKHGGLGIGLSIVRNLVELHGGRVRAESEGEDKGAAFTVELPISALHVAPPPEDRSHPAATAGTPQEVEPTSVLEGLRVLAVDDDPDTLEMVRFLLEQSGAEVRTADSARAALPILQEWLPDLLISDIGMPDEDGFELIRKVRALDAERGGRTPALALTAYARVADRLKVLVAGFQMHVPKPIEPAELIAVVNSLADWAPKETRH